MRLSLVMIVRDEMENLPACLKSVDGLVDEIIIADTGSTDGTLEWLAARDDVSLLQVDWTDDFSVARNQALAHATGDWILVLDADELLDHTEQLFSELANDQVGGYYVRVRNLERPGGLLRYDEVELVRLFRNAPEHRYEGRVHEQITPSLRRSGQAIGRSSVVIEHYGYLEDTVQGQISRRQRNLLLLEKALVEHPGDAYLLFHLGLTVRPMDQERSADLLATALDGDLPDHLMAKALLTLSQIGLSVADFGAAHVFAQTGLEYAPDHRVLQLCVVSALCSANRYAEAIPTLEDLVRSDLSQLPNPEDFSALLTFCKQHSA